ncbi:MAG: glycine zipper 2TM domain-containing protein [Pseudomonadota bacterium]
MKKLTIAALAASCLVAATPALAQRPPAPSDARYGQQGSAEDARFAAAQQRFASELAIFQAAFDRYQQTRARDNRGGYDDPRGGYNDPRYNDDRDEGDYDAARYYRDSPRYQERVLSSDDRVYRGRDGRYYCKRNDGTTGLIVGGIAGATLGNVIDGGHSRTAGTLIGAVLGAVAGSAIERNANNQNQQIRCR